MRKLLVSGFVLALLSACEPVPDAPDAPAAAESGGILEEPRREVGMQKFVAIAAKPDWARIEQEVRGLCEGETHCGVLGWDDPAQMASAMPMLDREAAALAFSYTLNRSTSFERFLVDCTRWPQSDTARCMAKFEPDPEQ